MYRNSVRPTCCALVAPLVSVAHFDLACLCKRVGFLIVVVVVVVERDTAERVEIIVPKSSLETICRDCSAVRAIEGGCYHLMLIVLLRGYRVLSCSSVSDDASLQ
jgi:hypothetical protein